MFHAIASRIKKDFVKRNQQTSHIKCLVLNFANITAPGPLLNDDAIARKRLLIYSLQVSLHPIQYQPLIKTRNADSGGCPLPLCNLSHTAKR